jgi:hypothetical protein
MNRREKMSFAIMAASGLLGSAAAFAAPTPILQYQFDDAINGAQSLSTGSDNTAAANLTFYNSSNVATNLHGAASSGVSGLADDLAFNLTSATRMGNGGSGFSTADGVLAKQSADNNSIDGLSSWTVSGWFKADGSAIGNDTQLVLNGTDFQIKATSAGTPTSGAIGRLRATVDNQDKTTSAAISTETQKWVFFAVTYSGTDSPLTGTLNFYRGYRNATEGGAGFDVTNIGTVSAPAGVTDNDAAIFMLGNNSAFSRPLDGLLDNIRVFGSKTDATGALSLADLQTIRANDVTGNVTAVPEPASLGLLSLGGLAMLRRRRRVAIA